MFSSSRKDFRWMKGRGAILQEAQDQTQAAVREELPAGGERVLQPDLCMAVPTGKFRCPGGDFL